MRRNRLAAVVVAIGWAVAGCSALGIGGPGTLAGGDVYVGEGAVTITVTTEQLESGTLYIEGALRYARLDGPSPLEWLVDDGSGSGSGADDRYVVGVQSSSVKPGDYTLTAWERSCSGNCDQLDPPTSHCSIEFRAMPGDAIEILVSYTIPDPCTAERLQ
jgi:hypothetical protein